MLSLILGKHLHWYTPKIEKKVYWFTSIDRLSFFLVIKPFNRLIGIDQYDNWLVRKPIIEKSALLELFI